MSLSLPSPFPLHAQLVFVFIEIVSLLAKLSVDQACSKLVILLSCLPKAVFIGVCHHDTQPRAATVLLCVQRLEDNLECSLLSFTFLLCFRDRVQLWPVFLVLLLNFKGVFIYYVCFACLYVGTVYVPEGYQMPEKGIRCL